MHLSAGVRRLTAVTTLVLVAGAGFLGAAASAARSETASTGFSGNVCALLKSSQIPHGVPSACHQTAPDMSHPGQTTYTAMWGSSGLHLQIAVSTFTSAAARATDLGELKQAMGILPSIGIPVSAVKVGSWGREYVTTKAAALEFVAGSDHCILFVLNNVAKVADNAKYRPAVLAVAQALAPQLS